MVELSEWLTVLALVLDQLSAKRSHEHRGATETQKLDHTHQTIARTYVTENKSQEFKNKNPDQCSCCNKTIQNSATVQTSRR